MANLQPCLPLLERVAVVVVDDGLIRSGISDLVHGKQTMSSTSSHGTSVTGRCRSIDKWISCHVPRAWPIAPVVALHHLYLEDNFPIFSLVTPKVSHFITPGETTQGYVQPSQASNVDTTVDHRKDPAIAQLCLLAFTKVQLGPSWKLAIYISLLNNCFHTDDQV